MKVKMKWAFGISALIMVALLFAVEHQWSKTEVASGSKFLNNRQNCAQRFGAYLRSPMFMDDIDRLWEELLSEYAKYENIDIEFTENHQPLQHTFLHVKITDRSRKMKIYENWFGNIFRVDGGCKSDFASIPREFMEYLAHFNMNILYKINDPNEVPRATTTTETPQIKHHLDRVAAP